MYMLSLDIVQRGAEVPPPSRAGEYQSLLDSFSVVVVGGNNGAIRTLLPFALFHTLVAEDLQAFLVQLSENSHFPAPWCN